MIQIACKIPSEPGWHVVRVRPQGGGSVFLDAVRVHFWGLHVRTGFGDLRVEPAGFSFAGLHDPTAFQHPLVPLDEDGRPIEHAHTAVAPTDDTGAAIQRVREYLEKLAAANRKP